ncbi:MAG: flavodoxin family protein [Bacteroidales bacterium]|jgi:multimeric flavodoxin WrbA|nr:flavodoxin family protein [Bacteroidales bacterium]
MKILAINGSPRVNGNTHILLTEMGRVFEREKIDYEILQVGNKNIRGCVDCKHCFELMNEKCAIGDDEVNTSIQKIKAADGIILGSPVYFSGIAGTMKAFLDRTFYVAKANGELYKNKVGTVITAVRRTGGSDTVDGLHRYLMLSGIVPVPTPTWGIVYGREKGEVLQDTDGLEIVRRTADNMVALLKKYAG